MRYLPYCGNLSADMREKELVVVNLIEMEKTKQYKEMLQKYSSLDVQMIMFSFGTGLYSYNI